MKLRTLAAALVACAPIGAAGDDLQGRWSLSLSGGTDVELSGDVHTAGQGRVLDLATAVESRSYSDIYDRGFRGQLSVGYGLTERTELFVRGSYYKASSDNLQVGNVAGLALFGRWSDYEEWGADLGMRYFFDRDSRLKPYVAPEIGFRSLSENPATFSVPAAGVTLSDVPFWDKSTVFRGGANVGVEIEIVERIGVGLETGVRWQSKPDRLNGLAGTGLDNINDTGSRLSMPLLVTLRLGL
jgi:hypothetical protein